MKKKLKKWLLASGLFGVLLTLSGCVQTFKSGPNVGKPTEEGIVYTLLVGPMINVITYFVDIFGGNYGFAVIALTIIVRALILPLGLHQSKKSNFQSEKMQHLKPHMDAIQKRQKEAVSQAEQATANTELQQLYKDNNMSMFGGLGCLPLLIQMPIFTALFFTIKYAPGIDTASFLGISLGKPSIILTVLAGASYLLQSYLGMIGVPEEQKKQMRSMMIMSPLMITFISFTSPAGVTLYWVVGGIFSCIQTLITNLYQKPRIREQVAEEIRQNPIKAPAAPSKPIKKAEPISSAPHDKNRNAYPKGQSQTNGRNVGRKQNIKK